MADIIPALAATRHGIKGERPAFCFIRFSEYRKKKYNLIMVVFSLSVIFLAGAHVS
jgi:hypothetical protein